MKLVPDVIIYGCIYKDNDNENYVSRDPGQRKAIPEWSNWKIAVGSLAYIGVAAVNKCQ